MTREPWNKGSKMPKDFGEKISNSLKGRTGKKSRAWKGDGAGYVAIHVWMKKEFGKADRCENPNCNYANPKRYEWASISRENKRERDDWVMLCPSCHRKYDINKLTLKELYESTN